MHIKTEISHLFDSLLFLAIGPFCDLTQDVRSSNHTEGATVAIEMQEYERERKLKKLNEK